MNKKYLGKKKILKIYINNQDKYENKPLWEALLLKVKELGLAGATVQKAVAGIGANTSIHTFNVLVLSQTLPLVIEIIDDEKKINTFLKSTSEMISEGLCTISDIEVIDYKHKSFNR